ncbi:hypothetical protein B0H14DRAFT_2898387 [Mycena olivaceomarginata]|nr:hypothetical protein B0H14DRAFT_3058389 [Mycena olivaceomarginata]KAJ7800690.1 hypothetical protein B0H14DRAFT_2898387 [Mycena olivaceomarginata]
MPSYPADSFVHRLTDHTCALPECNSSKSQGASMRLCNQCKTIYYCSRECQRAHWQQHKPWCTKQALKLAHEAEVHGDAGADFELWRVAMTPTLFQWICIYGLAVYRHPNDIWTKFVVLSIRPRHPRPSNARKLFLCEDIRVVDRAAARAEPRLLGGDPVAVDEMLASCREQDEQAKRLGEVGAAVLLIHIDTAAGDLVRGMPVIIRQAALGFEEPVGWKGLMKDIIDDGASIKRQIAKKERRGEL